VRPEPVPAAAVMADSLGLLRPLALEHGVSLSPASPIGAGVAAWADARRLRQVLLNLLTNGIKYNRRGGRVDLEAEVIGSELEFRVNDTGPGLTEDEQQRLFRPFERLGATQTAVDGTGIGLALSRSLVEAMGGRIGVRSEVGRGSTFWVRLPLATAAPVPLAPQASPASPGSRRLRALYIEDNPVNQLLMGAMLAKELDLDTAADPIDGLQQAWSHPPDLILLDIQLPGIDGYEVLRRLRGDARTAGIPAVAVSANAMPADLEAGAAAGFEAYLTKPVELDDLLSTVRRVTAHLRSPAH
jgi:CheY-like chemotaxis protein